MKKAPNIKLSVIDLEEIPEQIDISISLPEKKAPEEPVSSPKSNSVTLF